MADSPDVDVAIVGAGIVGLATAAALLRRHRSMSVAVLDKEAGPAEHQSGHNSGVVHSGLYYTPGSAKALLVADGRSRLERYCLERDLPYDRCGKVVVSTSAEETVRLAELERRGIRNGVTTERVGARRLSQIEPHVRGDAALFVADTAITDFAAVTRSLAGDVAAGGGALIMGTRVDRIEVRSGWGVRLHSDERSVSSRRFVNCAGLHSDRLARATGAGTGVSIVPFRGEYCELSASARSLVRNLIYPVPDPRWPFLGVHMTRMVDGSVHVGPNAVLSFGREAYDGGVVARDLVALARDRGLWRLAGRYWRTGAEELARSRSHRLLLRDVRRLLPEVDAEDLVRSSAGIRAQALDRKGRLLDDFTFARSEHGVHVINAPSPAATASLAIADRVVDELEQIG